MSAAKRNRAASKSMQEVAVPGWIKVIDKAINDTEGDIKMSTGWKDALYYTTLGTGAFRLNMCHSLCGTTAAGIYLSTNSEYLPVCSWEVVVACTEVLEE